MPWLRDFWRGYSDRDLLIAALKREYFPFMKPGSMMPLTTGELRAMRQIDFPSSPRSLIAYSRTELLALSIGGPTCR